MSQFRLVIVDCAKAQLENPVVKKILSDVVFIKQKHFLKSEPNYVVTDKHDMIGTHYLIYDTTEFLEPKLIFAMRTTFLSRALQHRIETPLMSIIPRLELPLQTAFNNFQADRKEIVDCNAWFVDPEYSKKNSGMNLSDLGYLMVCTHVLRIGLDHIVGCTNETYNASRWVLHIGSMPKGLLFEHPAIKAPHMMLLVDNFNMEHFKTVYDDYKDLIAGTYEAFPAATVGQPLESFANFAKKLYADSAIRRRAS